MRVKKSIDIWQDGSFVKWQKVPYAKEYILIDNNSNVNKLYYKASDKLQYKPTVVGKHLITIIAKLKDGTTLKEKFQAMEVRMISSYHTWPSCKFVFDDNEIKFTKLDKDLLEK